MSEQEIHEKYIKLLEQLKVIIGKTQARVICPVPDPIFEENINFFIKSFLISMCAYLESYLKEIAFSRIDTVNQKLLSLSIPRNLVRWDISHPKDITEKDLKFENLKISIKKKDLDEHISGNPYRTEALFKKIGMDLTSIQDFLDKKEVINSIVQKRNRIVHHNDDANDVSMLDLISYVDHLIEYINTITQSVEVENIKCNA
jgi:RiboL-PSP-HEPN